ncbi:thiolase family protein [Microtetraspora sp. NBRC 16547]|uniref:thiolase family protein n=1 Tax=Microtetraspora sp. NBRC 16547 TaxID=3030993 RepID=UPI0024A52DB6|nr:thiolase family protein [Microtetraspora sp. NBRC 16547]GLW98499.1 acetyl-CoA acetyltransferase [Microtetraspora sp. NBRC 16547]
MDPLTPVIVAARRTPIGSAGHALREVTVERLAAPVLRSVLGDLDLDPGQVADVVLGNCMGPGGNVARVSALAAGLPDTVAGLTVDRQCGSGLTAITVAASFVRAGQGDVYIAGGVESASTAPWRHWPPSADGEAPRRYSRAPFAPPEVGDPEMGLAAEEVARRAGIGRARQDAYAARSHARAAAAQDAGRFAAELVPVAGLERDERVRRGITVERLARLRPAFAADGTVTAGNSSGVNDGAAAVVIVPERVRARFGWPGLAILGWETAGVSPLLPGLGPVPAVRRLLGRSGLSVDDLGVIEVNEAFAGQVLACYDALGLDPDRVCRDGGALALGHPWGASGAVLAVRLFSQMVVHGEAGPGLAAIAVGGGMGVALLVERVA